MIRKNLKVWIFLGACAVVVSAGLISNWTKKESGHAAASQHVVPQPALQDNTDNNVQDLKNQLAAERQREAQAATAQAQANTAPTMMAGIPAQQGVAAGSVRVARLDSARLGSPVSNKESMRNHRFPRKSSRHSNWRPENGNWLITLDLHRILFMRVRTTPRWHLVRIRIRLWAMRRRRR